MARRIGDQGKLAKALKTWGTAIASQDDFPSAARLYDEALALERAMEDHRGIAMTLLNLGELAIQDSNPDRAAKLLNESLTIARSIGDLYSEAAALTGLGFAALLKESSTEAIRSFRLSIEHTRKVGSVYGLINCLEGLSAAAAFTGRPSQSATLLGAADKMRDQSRIPRTPSEETLVRRFIDLARSSVSEGAWRKAARQGEEMRSEEAVAYALQI